MCRENGKDRLRKGNALRRSTAEPTEFSENVKKFDCGKKFAQNLKVKRLISQFDIKTRGSQSAQR